MLFRSPSALLGSYQVHVDGTTSAEPMLKVADSVAAALANPTVVVEPTNVDPGDVITVTGTDLGDTIAVPIHLIASDGSELTVWTAQTDETGGFTVQVLVPHFVQFGTYQVHADGIAPGDATLRVGP